MWVIELQFNADEVCHVNKVWSVGKISGAPFGQLNLLIGTFKDTVIDARMGEVGDDPPTNESLRWRQTSSCR